MELELKHLSGYLPYGLKIETHGIITKLFSINPDYGTLKFIDKDNEPYNTSIKYIKPILRPIPDFTKEIEVNGEKFVPKIELDKICRDLQFYGFSDFKLFGIGESLNYFGSEYDLIDIYNVIQKLLEWHFDIYGLIEAGLAIDINTLKTK
jgi:hypothetical protein